MAVAQSAALWTVNPAAYRYDMSLYLDFTFGAKPVEYDTYIFAAFVWYDCRGVGKVLNTAAMEKPVVYLRAYSNVEEGENLTFKYFNTETEEESLVESVEVPFVSDTRLGLPSEPYQVVIVRHFTVDITAGEGGNIESENGRLPEDKTFEAKAVADAGYHFVEWSDGSTENPRSITVTEDMALTASFDLNTYKLTYKVDGVETESFDLLYKSEITPLEEPAKVGYTFSVWQNLPPTMPAQDLTVTGEFTINRYRLIFKIGETVVSDSEVDYNSAITAPAAPDKEGHTFAGWEDFPGNMPANDLTVTGSYTINSYKLTYKVDGSDYQEVIVVYDSEFTPLEEPSKTGYTFSGWIGVPERMPAGDVTVSGSFTINKYHLIFKIGDEVISDTEVEYNSVVIVPSAPEKEGHTFAGWSEYPSAMPANDLTVTGSYTVNKYKVTYMLEGETEPYATQEVDYGAAIPAIDTPAKTGYSFSGWSTLPETMPAEDIIVSGSFTINKYHLTFKADGNVVSEEDVEYGAEITEPEAPELEGHTFVGWEEHPATMPAEELTINAVYTVNKYRVTYMLEGETEPYAIQEVDYGTPIPAIDQPEKEGYSFTGWDNMPETMPAEDIIVKGAFTINSYTLSIYLDEKLYSSESVEYGARLEIAEPEVVAPDRIFDKWLEEIPSTMPAHDVELHAVTKEYNGIAKILDLQCGEVNVFDINGTLLKKKMDIRDAEQLSPGLYIINGLKILKK